MNGQSHGLFWRQTCEVPDKRSPQLKFREAFAARFRLTTFQLVWIIAYSQKEAICLEIDHRSNPMINSPATTPISNYNARLCADFLLFGLLHSAPAFVRIRKTRQKRLSILLRRFSKGRATSQNLKEKTYLLAQTQNSKPRTNPPVIKTTTHGIASQTFRTTARSVALSSSFESSP
jgi:hypothetical protein